MSFQNNESSELDFSIIDKKPSQQAKLNFSVESLLDQPPACQPSASESPQTHRNSRQYLEKEQREWQQGEAVGEGGSFLNDLQKMEQQLSFESQLYNVYQEETQIICSNSLNPTNKSGLHTKSNSHLKTTKQQSHHSRTLQLDDYGYLVLDFALNKKNKKTHQFTSTQPKFHTQHSTSHSQKLKLSTSSPALTQTASMTAATGKGKSLNKNSSLNQLLSPRLNKNHLKSSSKDHHFFKATTAKSKDPKNQLKQTLQKTEKISSKSKPVQKHLNTSKKTNGSTTIGQTSTKTTKSYTKSTRLANAYSQYYGFEEMGSSQRMGMKSNYMAGSEKRVGVGRGTCMNKKSSSKSRCKVSLHSPSSKELTMRFKKKRVQQVV